MKQCFRLFGLSLGTMVISSISTIAHAQSIDELMDNVPDTETQISPNPEDVPEAPALPENETAPAPETPEDESDIPAAPEIELPVIEDEKRAKDLTIRSESDRTRILNELYDNLRAQPDAESAHLVAEEIWAVFLQSRSATVDFLLLRGITAQKRGDLKLARRMYNHVLRLQPEYAEGWSRSGRLAIDEKDLERATKDTTQSLVLEPRHFYALWTLGNILETLGKQDEALEAYEEAAKLYPQHKEINERVEYLKADVQGKAL